MRSAPSPPRRRALAALALVAALLLAPRAAAEAPVEAAPRLTPALRLEPPALPVAPGATADLSLAPAPAAAAVAPESQPFSRPAIALRMAGGVATAFVAHEGCHLLANLALGNRPSLQRVTFLGAIPFFSISPDLNCRGDTCRTRSGAIFGPGPAGYYFITSAGLQCGHLEDELILSAGPPPRLDREPFLAGMLAFNLALAASYATADLTGAQPPEGDLRGMRDAGAPRRLMVGLVLGAAVLDTARWIWPGHAWLDWASRAAKVGTTGLTFSM